MSSEHAKEFKQRGFVVLRNVVAAETLRLLRDEAERLRALLAPLGEAELAELGYNLDMFSRAALEPANAARSFASAYVRLRYVCIYHVCGYVCGLCV